MFTIDNYVKAETLEQAYSLNQKKTATILGGCGWLKMGNRSIKTAIDLSALGLDKIEETDTEFKLGCMVTLRQIETNEAINSYFGGAIKESLRHIVGVQFRNCVTIGGSIWGRFGFSDPLTLMLALGAEVQLYHAGKVKLSDFVNMPHDKDILTHVILPKNNQKTHYITHRATATDFPVIACCVSKLPEDFRDNGFRVAIGARPQRASLVLDTNGILNDGITEESANKFADYVADTLNFSSNMRGSADFRRHLTRVLVRRALLALNQEV